MIYGKELEEYIRNMEKLAKGAKEKAQDPKTRAPMKYAMLEKDYILRADIARDAQKTQEVIKFHLDAERELIRIAADAERALENLDCDPERPSKVETVLEHIIKFTAEFVEWNPWEEGDTDGKG